MIRALAILALAASLFGCEDRYGTYITIRATNKDLRFDRIELYFGYGVGKSVPTTPKHPQIVASEDVPQLVVQRTFAPSDVQTFGSPQDEYTVWIPDGGDNDDLGEYVLAIGSVNGQRVAIGELFDFEINTKRNVLVYELALESYNDSSIEEWGRTDVDCLRYERSRGEGEPRIVSIVRDNDTDCDGFLDRSDDAPDCEPLLYCDGSGTGACIGTTPCLHAANECSVGACSNSDGSSVSCGEDTCVADALCEQCDLSDPPAEVLECALLSTSTHPGADMPVPTQGNEVLCNDPAPTQLEILLPFPCTEPQIDAVAYYMPSDPFTFHIGPGKTAFHCHLTIESTIDGSPFSGVPHLLVTLEIVPGRRTGFVLGLTSSIGACPPSNNEPVQRTYEPMIGTCPLPPTP